MAHWYTPTDAFHYNDLLISWECLKPLRDKSEGTGLMLIALKGWDGFIGEYQKIQYEHFCEVAGQVGALPAIVMAPNLPWQESDWYHNSAKAFVRLKTAIDFTADLPNRSGAARLSFHLNTLFTKEEWNALGQTPEEKYEKVQPLFSREIIPVLRQAVGYARKRGVRLYVENTPVPEFGDCKDSDLTILSNPYPLYSGRGINELRKEGLGIAMDMCHTFTIFKAVALAERYGERLFEHFRGIFPADVAQLSGKSILDEIQALKNGDIVHLNDSRNYFNPEEKLLHEEGVALGQGEISQLPAIIDELRNKDVHIVFEINESDYIMRPNLNRSVQYALAHIR